MVALGEIRSSNKTLQASVPAGQVSVFVGGTSGIGASTLKQLAISTVSPKIYLIGRSQSAAAVQLAELESLNPTGTFTFIEAQVSLLKEVDRVCHEIRERERNIDLLWLSTGGLSFNGRQDTEEGLALNLALTYYSRMRFIHNLLPQLSQSSHARVISLLAAGDEGTIFTDDLDLKTNYTLPNTMTHGATLNSLALEELSKENPEITFIHAYPGFVKTDLMAKLFGGAQGWMAFVGIFLSWTAHPIIKLISKDPQEAGERGLYVATSETFGKGFWRLRDIQEEAGAVAQLQIYREEGWPKKVWEHTMGLFQSVLGA